MRVANRKSILHLGHTSLVKPNYGRNFNQSTSPGKARDPHFSRRKFLNRGESISEEANKKLRLPAYLPNLPAGPDRSRNRGPSVQITDL